MSCSALIRRLRLTARLLCGAVVSRRIRYARLRQPRAVMVQIDHLGDVLISLPQILLWERTMRERQRRPVLLLDPAYVPLIRAAGFSGTVLAIAPQRFFAEAPYARKILKRLHQLEAESILNPVPQGDAELLASQLGGRAVYTAYAPERTGALQRLAKLCSHYRRVQEVPLRRTESIYANEARLMQLALGTAAGPGTAELAAIAAQQASALPRRNPYFVIAPGSSDARRIWPAAYWSRVILLLHERFPGVQPVITGSGSEKPLAAAILNGLPAAVRAEVVDQTGSTSVLELLGLLYRAEWVLGNDCGTLHGAALLRKPAVGVVGLGHWGCFFPNAEIYPTLRICHDRCPFAPCSWRCHFPDPVYRCLAAVTPESVVG